MTSLVNPNIAYLLLLFGTIALFLAMVTPGTGLIEGVAGLFLFLAAYEVFQLGFNWWALVILILSLVPFIYAIRKKDHNWALAISILFVIAGSLYLFPGKGLLPAVNPILAVVMSVLSAGFLWLVTRKLIQAIRAKPMQDPARVVGQIGEARSEILDNGSVQLASEEWSARSKKTIPVGSRVRVVGRDGFTLLVELEDHPKK
jgi:membrane-bound serine protease (ClpP class)